MSTPSRNPSANLVTRYGKAVAKPGKGEELAALLAEAGERAAEEGGCLQYHVNRQADDPDTIWVTEMWTGQEAIDASLEAARESGQIEKVMPLVESMEMVELEPVGGLAGRAGAEPAAGFDLVDLMEVEDSAVKFGFGEVGEARFASEALNAAQAGLSLHRIKPGKRQAFGHSHDRAEEVYVVIGGSGRVKLDDEVRELKRLDAIRVSPSVIRAFEAGPDGLEVLALGQRFKGDGEMHMSWWSD